MPMIMSASERTHPSFHQSIRNNAKHKLFCRRPLPLIPPRHGHPGRGPQEVLFLQSVSVVYESSLSRVFAHSLEDSAAEKQFQADLQRALQESQSQSQSTPQPIPQTAAVDTSVNPSSFLSERAQLERERLARQKRLRGGTDDCNPSRGPTPSTSTADSEDYESDDNDLGKPAAKRQHLATPRRTRILQRSKSKQSANAIDGSSKPSAGPSANTNQSRMFWRGEIRQTANMHVDPKKDTKPTFRLSEIVGEVRPVVPLSIPASRPRASSLRAVANRCSLCNYFFLLDRLRVRLQDVLFRDTGHHHIPPCH